MLHQNVKVLSLSLIPDQNIENISDECAYTHVCMHPDIFHLWLVDV